MIEALCIIAGGVGLTLIIFVGALLLMAGHDPHEFND